MARNRRAVLPSAAPPSLSLCLTTVNWQLAVTVNCLQAALNYNCQSNERSNQAPQYVYISCLCLPYVGVCVCVCVCIGWVCVCLRTYAVRNQNIMKLFFQHHFHFGFQPGYFRTFTKGIWTTSGVCWAIISNNILLLIAFDQVPHPHTHPPTPYAVPNKPSPLSFSSFGVV